MSTQRPPSIDPAAAARWAALPTADSPWLHEEVARRMEERLQWITMKPQAWAHWAPVRGGLKAHALISARYPEAECFVVEERVEQAQQAIKSVAKPWWTPGRWRAPAQRAERPGDGAVQLVWANMQLHSAADPQALIAQWHRALSTDGFLMFSCLGPDTAHQLREVYAAMGWPVPSHEFTDMHDWGDMLVGAGFAEPVMDMERIELTYTGAARLLLELREIGRNLQPQRFPALRGRGWRQKLEAALTERLADAAQQGRLSMTFELIYGHAFKPKPKLRVDAQSAISLRDMREMLTRGKPGGN
ncbi:biotin synthase [Variovorax sp. HJSM1_2]|uniref:biotin synthase n=1 Tax=Variovorax sp. HJSM1_2 TaxID=3366263 RepID=UPI003BEE598B